MKKARNIEIKGEDDVQREKIANEKQLDCLYPKPKVMSGDAPIQILGAVGKTLDEEKTLSLLTGVSGLARSPAMPSGNHF